MNEFAINLPSNQGGNPDISVFDTLYTMGFKQFSLNLEILKKVNWSIDAALDKLTNEAQLAKDYGEHWKNIM